MTKKSLLDTPLFDPPFVPLWQHVGHWASEASPFIWWLWNRDHEKTGGDLWRFLFADHRDPVHQDRIRGAETYLALNHIYPVVFAEGELLLLSNALLDYFEANWRESVYAPAEYSMVPNDIICWPCIRYLGLAVLHDVQRRCYGKEWPYRSDRSAVPPAGSTRPPMGP